ncbi:hypothetical protein A2276_05460 [candidate division WOR-1 bacterium RIFOXYA12_FULL_43_27]|uniref:Glycosyl transferase n=1 Tax=candidate division WOR-1 bacterium RIFOXYC2_FULL_46_14 TaxID=1802587 RepID=A0A1F4U3Y7_UNCSA|nr:MAG: hypothetical protein A2276_05460 [candidate division WOR-1 bacterium RIFOXYA12_FULL_43_27]OGC20113.1 MAG: hypothetical protein A2292_03465 [candidate division WOR-1 bacterium RIFOXYB2_FULL_46_45]OGC32150.1 MAG: hypothetical protein A2232_07985 [candidate division WOR-1 bacterium RIFOXYA2_FULL_46_56]OGC39550.1 MAG: hypothetical protein A2438_08350 [candidate division WOR-1 bacterium RIFOXYC2_FULL_46_14]
MKKIALVHDYLNQFGGAERVAAVLHKIFPEAPLYTSIYDQRSLPREFEEMKIKVSFMQYLPFVLQNFRAYFWLYPKAFESFDLGEYDLIVSSSSAYAKGIKKRKEAIHVCYCHNPMRFVWNFDDYVEKETLNPIARVMLPWFISKLKKWDLKNNAGVDYFIANSRTVAQRIKKYYGRDSVVINPPIECDKFSLSQSDEDYFLVVSRLNYYKRIDVAVAAFSKLGLPLKIVGVGPAEKELKRKKGQNIDFLGKVDDNTLRDLYSNCRGLIFTEEADFGMVPLEAAASGRPTIAFRAGGAEETIIDGETGLFFDRQSPESLIEAVRNFEKVSFDKHKIRKHAEKFDRLAFCDKLINFLHEIQAL